jgi:hypothetical protein
VAHHDHLIQLDRFLKEGRERLQFRRHSNRQMLADVSRHML